MQRGQNYAQIHIHALPRCKYVNVTTGDQAAMLLRGSAPGANATMTTVLVARHE